MGEKRDCIIDPNAQRELVIQWDFDITREGKIYTAAGLLKPNTIRSQIHPKV